MRNKVSLLCLSCFLVMAIRSVSSWTTSVVPGVTNRWGTEDATTNNHHVRFWKQVVPSSRSSSTTSSTTNIWGTTGELSALPSEDDKDSSEANYGATTTTITTTTTAVTTSTRSPFSSLLGLDDNDTGIMEQKSRLPLGIIFDMDGTLVQPCIDFASMRRRIYDIANEDYNNTNTTATSSQPQQPTTTTIDSGCVLEIAAQLSSPESRRRAQEVFADIEQRAIDNMMFMDGLPDLLRFLDRHGVRRAVLTRNVERSVDAMHDKLWHDCGVPPFFPALARDSCVSTVISSTTDSSSTTTGTTEQQTLLRSKPHPDAIRYICDTVWQCDPARVIMVGDSVTDDVQCANRAGCGAAVLLKYLGKDWDNDSGNSRDEISGENKEEKDSDTTTNNDYFTPTLAVENLETLRLLMEKNGHVD